MKTVRVKNCIIGSGRPKIAVSLTADNQPALLKEAQALCALPADIAEWRIDRFSSHEPEIVTKTLAKLRAVLGEKPLLATVRTEHDGGAYTSGPGAYVELLSDICRTGNADMLDIEYALGPAGVAEMVGLCRSYNVISMVSSHDFQKTPQPAELRQLIWSMHAVGADLIKIAVMPHSPHEVLRLLAETVAYVSNPDATPITAISMSSLGAITRISGESFGSVLTFASAGTPSAPGQLDVKAMRAILDAIHESC